jgi:hypothetical protein
MDVDMLHAIPNNAPRRRFARQQNNARQAKDLGDISDPCNGFRQLFRQKRDAISGRNRESRFYNTAISASPNPPQIRPPGAFLQLREQLDLLFLTQPRIANFSIAIASQRGHDLLLFAALFALGQIL